MDTIIYRKADKAIVGMSHSRKTPAQEARAVLTEIDNICASECGGEPTDYATVSVERAHIPGKVPSIGVRGTVTWGDAPMTERQAAAISKRAKMLALGFTEEEIDA